MNDQMDLRQIAIKLISSKPEGVTLSELVVPILETGYRHKHKGRMAHDLMSIILKLVKQGLVEKNLETRKIFPVLQSARAK